ncbi:MAG: hypothetical protein V1867_08530 [Candidatus Falkowbacteria bacterium]
MGELKLSQSTIEKLGYYVYLLTDPRKDKVFYVGKGRGNRINQHLLGVLEEKENEMTKEKIRTIKEIQKAGLDVGLVVLRHGLAEKEAFEVECAVIDLIGKEKLTNIVNGHHAHDRGIMSLDDIKIRYEAEEAVFTELTLLININRLYKPKMTPAEIYEVTHGHWRLNRNRLEKYKIVCGVYRGIIREVFVAHGWHPSDRIKGRSYFDGEVAPPEIRDKLIYKSVAKFWPLGSQFPIKYVGLNPTR